MLQRRIGEALQQSCSVAVALDGAECGQRRCDLLAHQRFQKSMHRRHRERLVDRLPTRHQAKTSQSRMAAVDHAQLLALERRRTLHESRTAFLPRRPPIRKSVFDYPIDEWLAD